MNRITPERKSAALAKLLSPCNITITAVMHRWKGYQKLHFITDTGAGCRQNYRSPVVLLSAVFSGMHTEYTSPLDFLSLFLISLILSFARVKSGSLLPSMLLHSVMNAFVIFFNAILSK
ncbi:CPBP family glutamic-type intramembrane protease [Pseudomonas cerasi]